MHVYYRVIHKTYYSLKLKILGLLTKKVIFTMRKLRMVLNLLSVAMSLPRRFTFA